MAGMQSPRNPHASWNKVKTELEALCDQTEDLVNQLKDSDIRPTMCAWVQPDISNFDTVWRPPQGDDDVHSQHGDVSDASSDTG
jgi:hypothetical protein